MRITLALMILAAIVTTAATPTSVVTTPVFALQDAAAIPNQGVPMGPTEIDLVKWGFTQGGLTLLLIVVLVSYRRDFFRKNDELREEKREQAAVIEKCANAMIAQQLATQANTKATELLAQNVNNLAERRHGPRG